MAVFIEARRKQDICTKSATKHLLNRYFKVWRLKFVRNIHFRVLYKSVNRRNELKSSMSKFKENINRANAFELKC
jgi:hypothetical protein